MIGKDDIFGIPIESRELKTYTTGCPRKRVIQNTNLKQDTFICSNLQIISASLMLCRPGAKGTGTCLMPTKWHKIIIIIVELNINNDCLWAKSVTSSQSPCVIEFNNLITLEIKSYPHCCFCNTCRLEQSWGHV